MSTGINSHMQSYQQYKILTNIYRTYETVSIITKFVVKLVHVIKFE